ncbi:MAG: tRNA (N(6)-L-threonylcarbamoyladenosine(37)-C(2))-methylthiotransferase MtaB [Planctomycetaceae bacterium]|nr:MAG: tRNA (N(6)-L-threonylcarbamoyladenosine(37)-C(2))-methylthiotransferase MtaB [Planctomycetaceae bacterium]
MKPKRAKRAHICVVNTCTVTATGDSKGRQLIRQLARRNPGTRTIVMGCYATRDPKAVAELPGVFEVVRTSGNFPTFWTASASWNPQRGSATLTVVKEPTSRSRTVILRCTYCIIPQVRPGLQSRSPEDIEEEVKRLLDRDSRNRTHRDPRGALRCRHHPGTFQSSPLSTSPSLPRLDRIPVAGECGFRDRGPRINGLHPCRGRLQTSLPPVPPGLQSGSNSYLDECGDATPPNSFSTRSTRCELTHRPAFTTDAIVGFPGETEEEFSETVSVCRQAGFSKIQSFPSAPSRNSSGRRARPNSPGGSKGPLASTRRDRTRTGLRLSSSLMGQTLEVLVERPQPIAPVSSPARTDVMCQ